MCVACTLYSVSCIRWWKASRYESNTHTYSSMYINGWLCCVEYFALVWLFCAVERRHPLLSITPPHSPVPLGVLYILCMPSCFLRRQLILSSNYHRLFHTYFFYCFHCASSLCGLLCSTTSIVGNVDAISYIRGIDALPSHPIVIFIRFFVCACFSVLCTHIRWLCVIAAEKSFAPHGDWTEHAIAKRIPTFMVYTYWSKSPSHSVQLWRYGVCDSSRRNSISSIYNERETIHSHLSAFSNWNS